MLPAMAHPHCTITRLRWADQALGYSYLRPFPHSAFEGLESIELCLPQGKRLSVQDHDLSDLQDACARAAPTLRHLKLCLDRGWSYPEPGTLESAILGPSLATSPECALRSLSFVDVPVKQATVLGIVTSNAATLRHLHIEQRPIKGRFLHSLAQTQELTLSTLQIDYDEDRESVCECAAVSYVNGGPSNQRCHYDWTDDDFTCHEAVRQAAEADRTSRPIRTRKCGFDPASVRELEAAIAETTTSDAGSVISWAPDSEHKWVWGRYFNPARNRLSVYCHLVPDDHPGGHATEVWRFTSREGEVAYGNEPLDWFEEWDPDEGDMVEPTPFGAALAEFHRDGSSTEERMEASPYTLGRSRMPGRSSRA